MVQEPQETTYRRTQILRKEGQNRGGSSGCLVRAKRPSHRLAEIFSRPDSGIGVASVFCDRLQKRNDPTQIINTIAHELARRIPDYVIPGSTSDGRPPLDLPAQMFLDHEDFVKFVEEPLCGKDADHGLKASEQRPLVLIVDALDECLAYDIQTGPRDYDEFIARIRDLVKISLEVKWLTLTVTSRPENTITNALAPGGCVMHGLRKEDLLGEESQADAGMEHFV